MSGRGPWGQMGHEKASNFKGTFRRTADRLLRDQIGVWTIVTFGVLSIAFTVVGPKILGHATDLIVDGAYLHPERGIDMGALGTALTWALALYVAAFGFQWSQGRLTTRVVQHMVRDLRNDVEAKLNRLPLSHVDRVERGDLMSKTTNDLDNVAQSLQQTISSLLTSILTVVGTLAMMLWISPLLSIIAVATIPIAFWLTKNITQRSQPHFVAQWASTGALNGHVEETFTGHEVVKVFGRQAEARTEFDQRNGSLFDAAFKAQFISGVIQPLMMFVSNVNYVLVAVVGAVRVGSGAVTIGDVQAFIQYSRQFTQPLTQVAAMVNLLQSGMASAERVFGLLDEDEESPDPIDAIAPGEIRGRVAFEDVSFSYTESPLIEHLDLVAEPGQTVAIVGPTGAGKTTLTNLVLRFYDLGGGRITLDGVDVAAMDRQVLRRNFGVVLQDTWLFKGTIRENIAYGAEAASEEQIVAAAKAAYVDHFVRTLPEGYDTVIEGEGTTGISAGQRQLLTIARAFLADPSVLVLDEATSSVDTRTEALVQQAMEQLRSGRTSFVVAHRLSTIRDADRIVVMDEGRIVEQGTHDELIAAGGAYQRLYAAQFAGAVG